MAADSYEVNFFNRCHLGLPCIYYGTEQAFNGGGMRAYPSKHLNFSILISLILYQVVQMLLSEKPCLHLITLGLALKGAIFSILVCYHTDKRR